MKLTSSRILNGVLFGLIGCTALIFALQLLGHFLFSDLESADSREPRRRSATVPRWARAQPPDKSFSVLMPRPAVLLTNIVQHPWGPLTSIQLGSTDPSAQATYLAAYTPLPAGAELSEEKAVFEYARQRFHQLGELRRDEAMVLHGFPGHETETDLRDGTNTMIMRVLFVGQRLYQLTAVFPQSTGPTTNTWRFLDSLQISTNSPTAGTRD